MDDLKKRAFGALARGRARKYTHHVQKRAPHRLLARSRG
jgi:hypothetical protein